MQFFGKYTTNAIGESTIIDGVFAKGVATAVAGGAGSVLAGGTFESGAVTAAYGYLFNQMMQAYMRGAFSSNRMYPNGDIGHAVVENTRAAFINVGEGVTDVIAVCGLVVSPCRGIDTALSWEKAFIELAVKSDGRAVVGAMAGEASSRIQAAGFAAANARSIPGNRLSKAFIESAAYVSGKVVEKNVMQQLKSSE